MAAVNPAQLDSDLQVVPAKSISREGDQVVPTHHPKVILQGIEISKSGGCF